MSLGVAGVANAELFHRDFPAKGSRQTAERFLKGRDSGPGLLFPKPHSTNSISKRLQVNQNTNIFNRQMNDI